MAALFIVATAWRWRSANLAPATIAPFIACITCVYRLIRREPKYSIAYRALQILPGVGRLATPDGWARKFRPAG